MTRKRLDLIEQNRVKELLAARENIAGNSGRVGLHTQTNGSKED
jgi:hypothetical protein